ncbi:hypothetical protein A3F03_02925 [Candidatus Roizmanbacteria bacterium RIFCSPHIGHO2_12_FULL_41_11]|uniref:Uncharacterized protein n=2 Tax=Candidatus Roizmaniibacteriota TaxID=1752723 RepID=A0A1F7J8B7_9BACT|nr:MAG: hypothetical protein A3F03_02925 [Candidatus Roizmanbacteria bacterium RIFCSPHIGHO2_12_FULL_41_11]OGK51859.1 MAG: hypothetical protein A2966_00575 [Candidatus Roizmanbacteria bacterium RIFCSPLOWO2_01_FULL_41_22]
MPIENKPLYQPPFEKVSDRLNEMPTPKLKLEMARQVELAFGCSADTTNGVCGREAAMVVLFNTKADPSDPPDDPDYNTDVPLILCAMHSQQKEKLFPWLHDTNIYGVRLLSAKEYLRTGGESWLTRTINKFRKK